MGHSGCATFGDSLKVRVWPHVSQILEVWVYDYDRVGSDEHLGHVEIPLLGIKSAPGSTVEDSWDLKVRRSHCAGVLCK